MRWEFDRFGDGEWRLDGKGSLNDAVEKPLPKRASFLLLNQIREDALAYMKIQSLVYDEEYLHAAKGDVARAANRIIEAMDRMPDAYSRDAMAADPVPGPVRRAARAALRKLGL